MLNDRQINKFEIENGLKMPKQYKDFLKVNDGFSFDGGIILYSLSNLKAMNESLRIQEYQPGYIAIGDDGGGLVFLMSQEATAKEVYLVDMSDYDIETVFSKVDSFEEWFSSGCNIITEEEKAISKLSEIGSVFLIKMPNSGMKDLVKIKQIFNLNISTSQLLASSKALPCELVSNIKYAKAIKLIEKVGQPDIFEFRE